MINLRIIERAVCAAFDVTRKDIQRPCRKKRVADVRTAFCHLARKHTRASFPQIALRAGVQDHSTAIYHATTRFRKRECDPDFMAQYSAADALLPAMVADEQKRAEIERLRVALPDAWLLAKTPEQKAMLLTHYKTTFAAFGWIPPGLTGGAV